MDAAVASVVNNVLVIPGTTDDDTIVVCKLSNGHLQATLNSTVEDFTTAGIHNLWIDGKLRKIAFPLVESWPRWVPGM